MTFVIDNAREMCFSPETAIPPENSYSSLDALFHVENIPEVPEELGDEVRRRKVLAVLALEDARGTPRAVQEML